MSSHTYAEPVKCKIRVESGNCLDALLNYLEHTTYEHEAGSKRGQPLPGFEMNGWALSLNSRYKSLFTSQLAKDRYAVHYINESENAAGGAEESCFFSEDKGALEQFCEDWNFDKSLIQTDTVVKQTL